MKCQCDRPSWPYSSGVHSELFVYFFLGGGCGVDPEAF